MPKKSYDSKTIRLPGNLHQQLDQLREQMPKFLTALNIPASLHTDFQNDPSIISFALESLQLRIDTTTKRKR